MIPSTRPVSRFSRLLVSMVLWMPLGLSSIAMAQVSPVPIGETKPVPPNVPPNGNADLSPPLGSSLKAQGLNATGATLGEPVVTPPVNAPASPSPEDLNRDPLFQEIKAAILNSPNAPKKLELEPINPQSQSQEQPVTPKRLAQPKLLRPSSPQQKAMGPRTVGGKKGNSKWEAAELVLRAARLLEEQSQEKPLDPESAARNEAVIQALRAQAIEILNARF